MSLSDDSLATYLIQKGHFLTALEFHQELLEGNNGVHSVAALNRFFGDAQTDIQAESLAGCFILLIYK